MTADLVGIHLRRWASSDFVWGQSDCSIVLADYVHDVTGRDGAAHLRGRYATRAGCNRISGFLRRGLGSVVGECAANAALPASEAPARGDIGVITFADHSSVGALCLGGDRWAVKSVDGLLMLDRPHVVAAWSVKG